MSQRNTIYTSVADVNKLLTSLGSTETLTRAQKEIHARFLSIFGGIGAQDNSLLLWYCAEKAFETLQHTDARYCLFSLTRFGIRPSKLLESDYFSTSVRDKALRVFSQSIIQANIAFLNLWHQKCLQMQETEQQLGTLKQQIASSINGNPFVLGDMKKLIEMMGKKEFVLQNPQEVETRNNADILLQGICLKFKNIFGERREIHLYMPGSGNVMTEVHASDGSECATHGDAFAKEVAECLQQVAAEGGIPVSYMPGAGQDPISTPPDILPTGVPPMIYPHLSGVRQQTQ